MSRSGKEFTGGDSGHRHTPAVPPASESPRFPKADNQLLRLQRPCGSLGEGSRYYASLSVGSRLGRERPLVRPLLPYHPRTKPPEFWSDFNLFERQVFTRSRPTGYYVWFVLTFRTQGRRSDSDGWGVPQAGPRAGCESASHFDPTPFGLQMAVSAAELPIVERFDRRPVVTPRFR
jgi:hypothetical protein